MIGFLAEKIAEYFCVKNVISREDKSIYKYGAEITLSSLIGYVMIFIIGIFTKTIIDSIVFLMCCSTVKTFSGGYHADTYLKCNIIFSLVYITLIFIKSIIPVGAAVYLGLIVILTAFIIMFILSPVENKNKPLSLNEKSKYREKNLLLFALWSLIGFILLALNIGEWLTIFLTMFSTAISMIVGKIKIIKEVNAK